MQNQSEPVESKLNSQPVQRIDQQVPPQQQPPSALGIDSSSVPGFVGANLAADNTLDVRPGNQFQILTADNAHEGDIENLGSFVLQYPDAGRPTQGKEKKKDDAKNSLVKKRGNLLLPNDMVLARVEYGQGGEASQQPVCLFKIIKLFNDRHRCATWMRVRWYGQEQDVFLGKYVEKKEKLTHKDMIAMERLRRQGHHPEQDVRFKVTPDENLFLCTANGSNLVHGRQFEPPIIVHWAKEADMLIKGSKKLRETVVRLITTDVRLLNLAGLDIVQKVKTAREKNQRPQAAKPPTTKRTTTTSESSDSESSSSWPDSDEESSSSDENLNENKRKKRKID